MAITRCGTWLKRDSRWRSWGKRLSPRDIDLTQEGGRALLGEWVDWGDAVALSPGEWLVVAAETGSRAHHSYDYALVSCGADGTLVLADGRDTGRLVLPDGYDDRTMAKGLNSTPYAYAMLIHASGRSSQDDAQKGPVLDVQTAGAEASGG